MLMVNGNDYLYPFFLTNKSEKGILSVDGL